MLRSLSAVGLVAALALTGLPVPAHAHAPAVGPVSPVSSPAERSPPADPDARGPVSPVSSPAERPDPADPDARGPVSPVSPVEVDGVPAELAPPPLSAVPHARRLAASGRFAEAAQAWEAMWRETGDPRLLYHAGRARARAGQHALALRRFTHALAALGGVSEAVRKHLEEKIAGERALTVAVRLRFLEALVQVPPHVVVAGRIALEPAAPAGRPDPQDRIDLASYQGEEIRVDPGPWRVRAELPNYAPTERTYQAFATPGEPLWDIAVERQMVAVDLRFSPPKALRGARLTLHPTDHTSRVSVDRPLLGPTQTVMLTTGTWQLRASSRRYRADRTLVIVPGQPPIDVVMAKDASGDQLSLERKALFGLLGMVAVSWYSGVGLMVGGANVQSKADKRNAALLEEAGVDPDMTPYDPAVLAQLDAEFPTAEYHRRLKLGSSLSFAGGAVASSVIGITLGLLPAMLRKKQRDMWITFGVGAAVLAGGAAWTAAWSHRRDQLLEPAVAEHRVYERTFDRLVGHQLGGSMLLGIGIGMVSFVPVYLAGKASKRRKQARTSAAPFTAPGMLGLTLRGRF